MTPSKLDLVIWRGATFTKELISQSKTYLFDPAVNNTPVDLKRSHSENLEHYGFNYAYVDFAADYTEAELIIFKPWDNNRGGVKNPLLILKASTNDIVLGSSSIKITIDSDDAQALDFESGNYKLRLTKADGTIDLFLYGSVVVRGDR